VKRGVGVYDTAVKCGGWSSSAVLLQLSYTAWLVVPPPREAQTLKHIAPNQSTLTCRSVRTTRCYPSVDGSWVATHPELFFSDKRAPPLSPPAMPPSCC
jgi:hypothetical protein